MYQPDNYLREAVADKDMDKIHGALVSLLQSDPAFMTTNLRDAVAYVKNANLNPFQEGASDPQRPMNKDRNAWGQRYFATAVTYLRHDFTRERFNHVCEVSRFTHQDLRSRQVQEAKAPFQGTDSRRGGPNPNPPHRRWVAALVVFLVLLAAVILLFSLRNGKAGPSSEAASSPSAATGSDAMMATGRDVSMVKTHAAIEESVVKMEHFIVNKSDARKLKE